MNTDEDEAILKAMKACYWLINEDLPLSKYQSLMELLRHLGVPRLETLKVKDQEAYQLYQSYYSATEILKGIFCKTIPLFILFHK